MAEVQVLQSLHAGPTGLAGFACAKGDHGPLSIGRAQLCDQGRIGVKRGQPACYRLVCQSEEKLILCGRSALAGVYSEFNLSFRVTPCPRQG